MVEMRADDKGLTRLEIIRSKNATREWVNEKVYKLMLSLNLFEVAYGKMKSKPGSMTPSTDNLTIDGTSYERIKSIISSLRDESYTCSPVKTVYIPKANGKKRKLGIPCTKDKLVQEVVRQVLEAIYDSPKGAYFSENSHGFRRSRSTHTALKKIQREWTGINWIIEGDIKSCFDMIDHGVLIDILREKIKDERFISLIRKMLKAGYLDIDGVQKNSVAGSPQGGIASPILSNIYLDKLDQFIEKLIERYEKGRENRYILAKS